jgi:hypothetical protein
MPLPLLFRRFRLAAKTRKVAKALFPSEQWVKVEPHIWVAQSRLIEKTRERVKWEREMNQVHILTSRGSIAYFLPDMEMKGESGRRCADLVLDGSVCEMKTVSGTRATLGTEFKYGYKQGAALLRNQTVKVEHSVFVVLSSVLSIASVKAKIAGELKERHDPGSFICYFEASGKIYSWSYEELRSMIRSTGFVWGKK